MKRSRSYGSSVSRYPSTQSIGRTPVVKRRNTGGRNRIPSTKLTGFGTTIVNQSYTTSRRFLLGRILGDGSGTLPSAGNFNFQLNQMPNYQEFTNLFDLFRVRRISYIFAPRSGTVSDDLLNNSPTQIQLLTTAVDTGGSQGVTPTLNTLLEYGSVEQHLMQQPVTVSFVPRTLDAAGVMQPLGSYIDTAAQLTSVPTVFNELRYYCDTTLSKYNAVEVYCEVLVEYKNSK